MRILHRTSLPTESDAFAGVRMVRMPIFALLPTLQSPFFPEDEGSRFLLNATNYQTTRRHIQKTVVVITAVRT
jgi:hypothetical protein